MPPAKQRCCNLAPPDKRGCDLTGGFVSGYKRLEDLGVLEVGQSWGRQYMRAC